MILRKPEFPLKSINIDEHTFMQIIKLSKILFDNGNTGDRKS